MLYMALDEKTPGSVTTNEGSVGIDGYTKELGNFTIRLLHYSGQVYQMSHLTTRISGLDKIKEITEHSLHAVRKFLYILKISFQVTFFSLTFLVFFLFSPNFFAGS